ncbi:MAG: hypothetical protein ACP5UB_01760 [Candidatus Sumerlaeaceae bacterium]
MSNNVNAKKRQTKIHLARGLGAWVVAIVLLSSAAPPIVLAQQNTEAGSAALSADEVEKQRLLDEKIEIIRKAFVSGDYAEVLRLCDEANQIMPNNDSVGLYREWARQRLQQSKVGRQADVEPSEAKTPAIESLGRPTPAVVPQRTGQQASKQPEPLASSTGRDALTRAAQSSQRPAQPAIVVGIVMVLLGVGAIALFLFAKKKRTRRAAGEKPIAEPAEGKSSAPRGAVTVEAAPQPEFGPTSDSRESLAPSPASALGGGLDLSSATPGLGLSSPILGSQHSFATTGAAGSDMPTTEKAPENKSAQSSAVAPAEQFVPEVPLPEPPPIATERPWEAPSARDFDLSASVPTETSQSRDVPNIVSFEDLGIELPIEESSSPSQKTYTAHLEDSKIVITPAQQPSKEMKSELPPASLGLDSEAQTLADSAPPDVPALQLEDILGGVSAAAEPPVADVRPPANADIAEQSREKRSQESPASQPPEPSSLQPLELDSLALQLAEGELDGLSSPAARSEIPPAGAPPTEDVSTIIISPPPPESSDASPRAQEPEETKTLKLQWKAQHEELAETKIIELPTSISQPAASQQEKAPSTPPPREQLTTETSPTGKPKELDERSERMFQEQYQRGLRALEEQNYKQAVHFLSIAAAIHPENEEVRQKLRLAREKKRQQM